MTDIFDFRKYKSYHRLVHYPDWFDVEYEGFKKQVMDMASQKKPFKCSDTFKIQAGYPHEVESEQKERLIQNGIKRDYFSRKYKISIPKIDIHKFIKLDLFDKNPIVFTTPKESNYIRDITIVDTESHNKLSFIYIINRRAQIICSWTEPKKNNKYLLKLPKNLIKSTNYQTE